MPECKASAVAERFEFPAEILVTPVVFEDARTIGTCDFCLGDHWPGGIGNGELHSGASLAEIAIDIKGSPFAQMLRIGKGFPYTLARMVEFAYENECPV